MELHWRFRAKAWGGAFAKLHRSKKRIEGLEMVIQATVSIDPPAPQAARAQG